MKSVYCRIFSYSKCNRVFRRKTNDTSCLFKQRDTLIPILIVSARTFSRPTEAATEHCSLRGVPKKHAESVKNNCKEVHFSIKLQTVGLSLY